MIKVCIHQWGYVASSFQEEKEWVRRNLSRFDSCDRRRSRWTLCSHIQTECVVCYLHAFLQCLQESSTCGLHHVSSVYGSLRKARKLSARHLTVSYCSVTHNRSFSYFTCSFKLDPYLCCIHQLIILLDLIHLLQEKVTVESEFGHLCFQCIRVLLELCKWGDAVVVWSL